MSEEDKDRLVSKKNVCPECGKDNAALYADGHYHCFTAGCEYHTGPTEAEGLAPMPKPKHQAEREGRESKLLTPDARSWPANGLQKRRIELRTMKQYGVFVAGFNGMTVQVYPYYDQQGNLANQKLRTPDKDFPTLKEDGAEGMGKCKLFGQQAYGDKFDRQVIVCEGELDALSVAQIMDFRVAVVSINSGAGNAAANLKANYLWLDRFEDIVLWMDNDEAGALANEECAKLFKVGKVRIARASGEKEGKPCKDASDMLQAGLDGDIKGVVYAAAKWRPRGIVNAAENKSDVHAPKEKQVGINYPPMMEHLQEMTGGMFPGEVIYHVAGTGIGKSTALREIEYATVQQGQKIAVLSFEDTIKDAKFGLMSIAAGERLQLRDVPDPEDAKAMQAYDDYMDKVHDIVFGPGLVELFDPETAEWSMEAILGYIRYCAKALDCKLIVLDPISFVAAGIDLTADERRMLDFCAKEFAKLAKELSITLIISHHLKRTNGIPHEEGAATSLNEMRSSGGLANFATCVIGWERNNQAEADAWRVTQCRIIKPVRRTGRSGLADVLYYQETGRLIQSPIPFPEPGKPSGDHEGRKSFGPVSQDY
jgi:twinkle protein